jgi:CRP-like cAMP-binding protein
VVIGFPRAAVLRLMEEDAKFARDFCQILAHQVQGLRAKVELRGIRSAEDRILAALSLRLGDDEDRVDIVGTWKDFAHDLGLTHEALYRALRRLEDDGRIRREKMGVWVTATGGI